jgi:rubrerythrin
MSQPYDRPTSEPGGMECQTCGVIFVGAEWHYDCAVCDAKRRDCRELLDPGEGLCAPDNA